MPCSRRDYAFYCALAVRHVSELGMDELMHLTGHDDCCGADYRREKANLAEGTRLNKAAHKALARRIIKDVVDTSKPLKRRIRMRYGKR